MATLVVTDEVILSVKCVKDLKLAGFDLSNALIITSVSSSSSLPLNSSSVDNIICVSKARDFPAASLLAEMNRIVKPDGNILINLTELAADLPSVKILSSLKGRMLVAGFVAPGAIAQTPDAFVAVQSIQVKAKKPSWKTGSSFSIRSLKVVQKVQIDDEIDLIEEDTLLTEEDLKKPVVPPVGDCEVGSTRKACKNCTCGRAEAEQKVEKLGLTIEQLDNPQSACGSCGLGDAFRCGTCPYKGLPLFKLGEKVKAKKPSWKTGSSFSIRSPKVVQKVQIDDEMDLIEEDTLLTEEDLKKPVVRPVISKMADEVSSREMIQCTIPHPQQSITSSDHIHRLCDDLLKEILLRLPTCKSVIQIKCVCRRWDALTSHPSFSVNFIHFKLKNGTINFNNQPEMFAYVMRYEPDLFLKLWEKEEFQSFFAPSIFQLGDSSFAPLHCHKDENTPVSMPVASSQDLLLYCRHESDKYDYYISNVQTKESVMLPSSSSCSTKRPHQVGFICDPFYSSGREVAINAAYNYSIVVVCRTSLRSTKFCAHVFSTHCGSQWCDKVLSLPQQCQLPTPGPTSFSFCFDGKLYFSCRQGLFCFDHNSIASDDEIQCHLIRWPVGMLQGNHKVCFLQGRLHACAFALETSTFKVWILEDYKEGNWMLQHIVGLSDWLPCDPLITTKLQKFARHHSQLLFQGLILVLGFHPSRSNAIYLLVPGFIFLCDLSTKAIEFACRIPVAVAEEYQHYLSQFYIFPVKFQMWPTPLPPLAQGLDWTQHNSCICSRALA